MLLPAGRRDALLPHLVSFATGALLGAALLALLPHAFDAGAGAHGIGIALAGGIIAFFVLEKLVLWRHCHVDSCEAHGPQDRHRDRASATLILWGDAIHNVLDGVLIAAAFLTNQHLGVVTAVAVFASRQRSGSNPVALFLRDVSNSRQPSVNVVAEASIDNRIVGVGAIPGGAIPALPLAALELDPSGTQPETWVHQIEERAGGCAALWQTLRGAAPLVVAGRSPLPDRPGIGIELDMARLTQLSTAPRAARPASFNGLAGAGPDA